MNTIKKLAASVLTVGLVAAANAQTALPDPQDTMDAAESLIIAAVGIGAAVIAWKLGKRALKFIFG